MRFGGKRGAAARVCSMVVSAALARASVDWEQVLMLAPALFFIPRTRLV